MHAFSFFFCLLFFFFHRSVQGEDIGIQIHSGYREQMSVLASKGNGNSRYSSTPGAKQHKGLRVSGRGGSGKGGGGGGRGVLNK